MKVLTEYQPLLPHRHTERKWKMRVGAAVDGNGWRTHSSCPQSRFKTPHSAPQHTVTEPILCSLPSFSVRLLCVSPSLFSPFLLACHFGHGQSQSGPGEAHYMSYPTECQVTGVTFTRRVACRVSKLSKRCRQDICLFVKLAHVTERLLLFLSAT